jgi:glucokinase
MKSEDRYGVVDLGGTNVRTALAGDTAQIRAKIMERTDHSTGAEGVMDQIVGLLRQSCAQDNLSPSDLGAIVVAAPGPLNAKTGIVFEAPNMPGWTNIHLKAGLEKRLASPVRIVNDANAAAFGESHHGAGEGCGHLVYMTVSTGIGGGIVSDGKLLEGTTGTAGEVGHMTIDRHGPPCPCGNIGCLEVIASGTAIGRNFRKGLSEGRESVATTWVRPEDATAVDVVKAAQEGDDFALEVFSEAAEAVGVGVVNCVNLFNPDVVAIGGGVSQAGDLLFDTVRRAVRKHALLGAREEVRVVPAKLGGDVGLIGAATVAAHG